MPELIIGGIALGPIVVALVELAKALGLPRRFWPFATVAFSTAAFALVQVVGLNPDFTLYVVPVLQILIIVLTALGYYHTVVKSHAERQANAK